MNFSAPQHTRVLVDAVDLSDDKAFSGDYESDGRARNGRRRSVTRIYKRGVVGGKDVKFEM